MVRGGHGMLGVQSPPPESPFSSCTEWEEVPGAAVSCSWGWMKTKLENKKEIPMEENDGVGGGSGFESMGIFPVGKT